MVRAERLQRGGALGQCVWVAGGGLICECMEPKWTGSEAWQQYRNSWER